MSVSNCNRMKPDAKTNTTDIQRHTEHIAEALQFKLQHTPYAMK